MKELFINIAFPSITGVAAPISRKWLNTKCIFILLLVIGVSVGCQNVADSTQKPIQKPINAQQYSPQLRRVLEKHSSYVPGSKSVNIQSFWDDLGDVLDVILADAEGALLGAGVGALVVPGNATAVAIGAVAGAVISSVREALEDSLVAPGSPNPFDPAYGSYSWTKPNSSDSIGWLHNDCLQNSVINGTTLSGSEVYGSVSTRLVNIHGWSSASVSSVTWENLEDDITDITEAEDTEGMISVIYASGRTTEANYLSDLIDDLKTLIVMRPEESSVVFELIEEYKADVESLGISLQAKMDLKRALSVFAYSAAMWTENR